MLLFIITKKQTQAQKHEQPKKKTAQTIFNFYNIKKVIFKLVLYVYIKQKATVCVVWVY